LSESMDRARERRLLLDRQIADMNLPDAAVVAPTRAGGQPADAVDVTMVGTTAQQLESIRARLKALRPHYKPDHPDIRTLERTERNLVAKLEVEASAPGTETPAETGVSPADSARQKRVRDLQAELAVVDRELADKEQSEARLRGQMLAYQTKL